MATCETCRWFKPYDEDEGFCRATMPPVVQAGFSGLTPKHGSCAIHQPKENTDASSD